MTSILQVKDPISTLTEDLDATTSHFIDTVGRATADMIESLEAVFKEASEAGVDDTLITTLIQHYTRRAVAELAEINGIKL